MATGSVAVRGLKQLTRDFKKMSKDLSLDLTWELQEAADPVRKLSEEYILRGGGGFPAMRNMPATPFYADMRIGVDVGRGVVYVAPAWSRGTGAGSPRPNVAMEFGWRMEGALEDKEDEVFSGVDAMLDRIANEFGF
jgi:hypothetical protein